MLEALKRRRISSSIAIVDDVGQIVAGPRGLQAGLDDYLPGSCRPYAVTPRNSRISAVCRSPAASYGSLQLLERVGESCATEYMAHDWNRNLGAADKIA